MRVLIIGHTGQDGTLLRKSVEAQGSEVFGISRNTSIPTVIPGCPEVWTVECSECVRRFILTIRPDEIYYLAAYHTSSEGNVTVSTFEAHRNSYGTHVLGLLNVLEVVASSLPNCSVFYAASSLVFDSAYDKLQDENYPFKPNGFYGMTKAHGIWLCRDFRTTKGVNVSTGILYNHESSYRAPHFLSQKIVRAAARIAMEGGEKLKLGDVGARVDWGYAEDYIRAFQSILRLSSGDDFIVATGEAHSVEEFAELSFNFYGLDWRDHTEVDRTILKRRVGERIGNASKLRTTTGWETTLNFRELVEHLCTAEQNRRARLL